MPDSDAVRSRRYRAHRQGNHVYCKHPPARQAGLSVVREIPPGELDPADALRSLAAELHEAYRADPSNAAIARELRMTLLSLKSPDEDNELADLMRTFGLEG